MVERDRVIKGLECCSAMCGAACRECPYNDECMDVVDSGVAHLAANALELLKEQLSIVRCKDCKYHSEKYLHANGHEYVVCWHDGYGIHKLADGFCNYGERKDNYND